MRHHFYARVQGDILKTEATRGGERNIESHTSGWDVGVRVEGSRVDEDCFEIYRTSGSNGCGSNERWLCRVWEDGHIDWDDPDPVLVPDHDPMEIALRLLIKTLNEVFDTTVIECMPIEDRHKMYLAMRESDDALGKE